MATKPLKECRTLADFRSRVSADGVLSFGSQMSHRTRAIKAGFLSWEERDGYERIRAEAMGVFGRKLKFMWIKQK